ncbi:Gmad2 immunoglobulin-like domain-containing protein [Saccharothrix variisporea]|uniref:Sporulation and spore germination protein n=1 Tax=Saccharothrix variisporea TaxID=543527 RepID=A0A495XNR4_9PSEU|nr:Gmad2 immunoglobulin-like domain-containing protein [Saccharothrix variisporea]RKT74536.1 sporulation and spore germination protein [Saccharothrix variisporea]
MSTPVDKRRVWWVAGGVVAVLVVVVVAAVVFVATRDRSTDVGTPSSTAVTTPSADTMQVRVFFHRGEADDPSRVSAVLRTVPRSEMVATAALTQLLGGTTAAEAEQGYWSQFVPATAGSLHGVRIEDGVAHADFANFSGTIPNASSSFGSAALLAELDSTLKQFPTVRSTVYSFDGDVAAFYEWLQLTPPTGKPGDTAPAVAEARRFLKTVVGMADPAEGPFRWVDDNAAEVTFYGRSPNNGEPVPTLATVVSLRRDGRWSVTGTRTDPIRVDAPTAGQTATSPLRVTGAAHTFEGHVTVRVLSEHGGKTTEVGTGFVTGGGDEQRPFSGDITFTAPNGGAGWVVFAEPSAADGQILHATTVRVVFPGT